MAVAGVEQIFSGSIVYLYSFDLGYDMKRIPLTSILGEKVYSYAPQATRRIPKQVFFYRPQAVKLPRQSVVFFDENIELVISLKIFSVAAMSFQVRVNFEVDNLEKLIKYHNPMVNGKSLEEYITILAEKIHGEVKPFCIKPAAKLGRSEAYTIFSFERTPAITDAESWLVVNRKSVGALLAEESDHHMLSCQEAEESTANYLSYYRSDLIVADWDAAIVLGEKDNLEDIFYMMELANVQLVELSAYDQILDAALHQAYRDLATSRYIRRSVNLKIREITIDMARINDELSNITKFIGDWHLARVYNSIGHRFHLNEYRLIVTEKLRTLGSLYQMLQQDYVNALMVILEAIIVLLFILDVILLLLGL